ncbi:MAG: preprotein translocase subunit YajC [Ruminococcaceae bacterium]|nr:preprotein translocase subunit YajC [Oscillospiraceae bacterium]
MEGNLFSIIAMVAIIPIFYFLLIRPQKKQEKETKAMRDNLEVGDEITTIGGIIGEIISIKEETVMIETGKDRTKIRILRSAVSRVDVKASEKEAV